MNDKKVALILVGSMGCSEIMQEYGAIEEVLKAVKIVYVCNDSLLSQYADILKFKLFRTGAFVSHRGTHEAKKLTKNYLQKGYVVVLVGFSYGGAIVSHIAEFYDRQKTQHPVFFLTLGSIYVPRTKNVRIVHYMNTSDVALRVNRMDKQRPELYPHVEWLPTPTPFRKDRYPATTTMAEKILGSKREWGLHTHYDPLTLIYNYIFAIYKNYDQIQAVGTFYDEDVAVEGDNSRQQDANIHDDDAESPPRVSRDDKRKRYKRPQLPLVYDRTKHKTRPRITLP